MRDFQLNLFANVLQAPDAPVLDLTPVQTGWRRTIRSMGGPWQGWFDIVAPPAENVNRFYTWLGNHVRERSAGATTWGGLLWELELSQGGVIRRRSLEEMWNRIRVDYTDPASVEQSTAWAAETRSSDMWGVREQILSMTEATPPQAEGYRDTELARSAWPAVRPVAAAPPGMSVLSCTAAGYAFTANNKYLTQTTELDVEQGNLSYTTEGGDQTFTDDGQDFTDWETAAGDAAYSLWVVNDDGTLTWGYLGAAVGATEARVYTDQACTATGWNGVNPGGKTPSNYTVKGGSSAWITAIVNADCEYVLQGRIDTNLLQVNRMLTQTTRTWAAMEAVAKLGDVDGNPWRLWVGPARYLHYMAIDKTPRYYIRDGILSDMAQGPLGTNPWQVQPAVARDLSWPVRTVPSGSWLDDGRDMYVDEVEVDENGVLTWRTADSDDGDLLAAQAAYWESIQPQRIS